MSEADAAVRVEPGGLAHGPDEHDVPKGGRSGFTVIGGRQVHYLEWGPASAPAVLAMHGGGQTAYMFEDIGYTLRERLHVIAIDLPGHGESGSLTEEGVSRQAFAETLPPLLDDFGVRPVAIIGASLGGIIGLTLAAAHPELVSALVMIDVGHKLEPAGVQRIIDFMTKHESFGSLEEAAAAIAEYLPNRKPSPPDRLKRNLRQRPDGRWVWKHSLGRISRERLRDVNVNWENDILIGLGEEAATVTVPVLVLRGASSDVLSSDGANEVTSILPNARLATISSAGHLAAGDNPASTANLIKDFFDEVLPTTTN
ncbi:MAG TPA: alpha/beta hydrolase [Mycobacteriales bacterium]|nr:alpha/beta hydrolase [Mycobacteriales bacterium]